MTEPSRHEQAFLPLITEAFSELGYRRATTAELARRCGVQENVLYRVWPSKKAMFLAAIGFIYDRTTADWARLLDQEPGRSAAERILAYQARHHGETGMYRIIFAGLSETDDPEVRRALRLLYRRFHRFITEQLRRHRGNDASGDDATVDELTAWGIVGLAAVSDIGRELDLLKSPQRRRLIEVVGQMLLDANAALTGR